jgi:hypothetical protein
MLGSQRNISRLKNVSQAPVRGYYDPNATQYCASSNITAGEIGWKLQLKKHAFYGALIPDMLFVHEYISHLLPLSRYLSRNVREIWLALALFRGYKNSLMDADQKYVRLFLWDKFRRELALNFSPTDIELYGPLYLDSMALNVSFYAPEVFWQITSDILHLEDLDVEGADAIDDLLGRLAVLDDSNLRLVLSRQWVGWREFHSAVCDINY